MVFGRSREDKRQDAWLKQLWTNQQALIKNGKAYWSWIQKLHNDNKAQDKFDKQVIQSLQAQDAKIGNQLELAKRVQTLEKIIADIQATAHKHTETENV